MKDPLDVNVPEIFKALKKVKENELLPEGEVSDYFSEVSQYPGFSLYLRHKKDIRFFYIDHDDFLSEIKDQTPVWNITMDGKIVRISLVYKYNNADVSVTLTFNAAKKEYAELIDIIRRDKSITLYFLVMLYGGLVLDSVKKLKMPSDAVKVLKTIQ